MKRIRISQVDVMFINGSYPIEFLLFYKNALPTQDLRSTLKKSSSAFWQVFGRYDDGVIQFDKYREEDCYHEDTIDSDFNSGETETKIHERYSGVNPVNPKRLFFLSVLQHKNGTVLIPKMNHLAGDGYSYFYFLSTLAAMCKEASVPLKSRLIRTLYKPHHNRTVLKEFKFSQMELPPTPEDKSLTIMLERIPKTEVRKSIKEIAAQSNRSVSANDLLSTMVAKKLMEIQKDYFGDDFELTIPIDVRGQIKEYSKKFFGNPLLLHTINFKTKRIADASVEEIAIDIRKSMPGITKESYLKYLKEVESYIVKGENEKLRPYDPQRGCLVTNLSRLPTNQLDFGSGNPDLIFPLTIGKNSTAILANSQNYVLRLVY